MVWGDKFIITPSLKRCQSVVIFNIVSFRGQRVESPVTWDTFYHKNIGLDSRSAAPL